MITQYFQIEIINLIFIWELPLKWIGPKQCVHHKIEIAFNFTKEIPVQITRTRKKIKSETESQKYTLGPWNRSHFWKNHPNIVILKKVGQLANLLKMWNAKEICCTHFIYVHIYTPMSEVYTVWFSRKFEDQKSWTPPHLITHKVKKTLRGQEWDPNKIEENQMAPNRKASHLLPGG